jgi:hypothetical protein
MPNGYTVKDLVLDSAGVTCAASSTTAVSRTFNMSGEDSRNVKVALGFSSMEEVTGITFALQHSYDGGTTWENVKSAVAITTVAKVDTLTFPAKASATASDYFVIYDSGGDAWACALDVTGSDTAPTGALWAAIPAARKVQADISGDTTAAQVAASVEAAFDGLTGVTNEFTTDDTAADGTMTFTWVRKGNDGTATSEQVENDSGSGSITIANTTAGSFTEPEVENNIYDGTDTATWPLARVVVITDTSDAATCDNVYVSRRL